MRRKVLIVAFVACVSMGTQPATAADALSDPNFFPLAVWVQSPAKAPEYKKAGINTYVALWRGPTDEQLDELKKHDMKVICSQNKTALARKDDRTIIAWMHG